MSKDDDNREPEVCRVYWRARIRYSVNGSERLSLGRITDISPSEVTIVLDDLLKILGDGD